MLINEEHEIIVGQTNSKSEDSNSDVHDFELHKGSYILVLDTQCNEGTIKQLDIAFKCSEPLYVKQVNDSTSFRNL